MVIMDKKTVKPPRVGEWLFSRMTAYADHYASLGVIFDNDDIPTNSTGVNEISYPNSVFGGYPPWSAKEIAVTISPPSERVGAWTIDSGGVGSPAGNEATARFYDSFGNLLGAVYADPNLIPARQFLGLEALEGIAKVTFRETVTSIKNPPFFTFSFYYIPFITFWTFNANLFNNWFCIPAIREIAASHKLAKSTHFKNHWISA